MYLQELRKELVTNYLHFYTQHNPALIEFQYYVAYVAVNY